MTDELGIAEPRKTIQTRNLMNELKRLKEDYEIEGIVMGLPLTTKGRVGERAKMVEKIKEKIEDELRLPVELYDERFTTKEAIEIARGMGRTRDKNLLDRISATLILKGYLEEN